MRMLKFGDVGDDVRQVQNDIDQYYDEPGFKSAFRAELMKANLMPAGMKKLDPDGKFGPLTQAAVRAFQTYRALTIDGIAGPETLSALYPYAVYRIQANVSRAATQRAGSRPVGDAPAKDSARRSPCRSSATTSSSSRSLSISAPSCRRRFLRLYRRSRPLTSKNGPPCSS